MLDAIRNLIAWTPLGLPAFLFVITLVVFFHELGHFLVARFFGVKVDTFSVGFDKEIFGWTDQLVTRGKVSLLPIGCYLKFAGDANAASQPDMEAAANMTAEERKVIFASSLGTVFEWYDFYLYGSLAAIIAKQFFAGARRWGPSCVRWRRLRPSCIRRRRAHRALAIR